MKQFKYTYDDGQIKFEGYAKGFEGINRANLVRSKGFVKSFHRAYPGRPYSEITIDLSYITLTEVKDV